MTIVVLSSSRLAVLGFPSKPLPSDGKVDEEREVELSRPVDQQGHVSGGNVSLSIVIDDVFDGSPGRTRRPEDGSESSLPEAVP